MQSLVHEIILPVEPLGNVERIKTWLGIDGVAARMRRMGVPPRAAEFMEMQSKIDEVTEFAEELWERHFRDDEMPPKVMNVSRVNELVGQVLNGGLWQFVHNSNWDKSFVDGVRAGLVAMGATEHLAVFEGAARLIDEAYEGGGKLDFDNFQATVTELERKHLTNLKLTRRTRLIVNDSWTRGDRWQCIQVLNARYIASWRDVRRVPLDDYPAVLDSLSVRIPDLAARREMREDARPWEKKIIDRFVAQIGFDYVWYTTFSTREYNGRKLWCWNFVVGRTPGEGIHRAVFVDGEAIIFDGRTETMVARMPAPECDPGSSVDRNEPDGGPEAQHPNVSILIQNP